MFKTPWKLYIFKYENYPEYSARITGHYAGDMLLIEEKGELSETTVNIIKDTLGINKNVRDLNLEIKDVMKLPFKNLPSDDRELLLNTAGKLDSDSKLHIEYIYHSNIRKE